MKWQRRPSGIQVRLSGGEFADIPDTAVKRLHDQDQDGNAAWAVAIPAYLRLHMPPEVRIARLPARCTILIDMEIAIEE